MSSTTFSPSQQSSKSPNSHPSTSGNESRLRSPSWLVVHSESSVDNAMEDTVDAQIEHSLWFHDGTVVLQAGSSLFKLHTSILGQRSVVFDNCLNWGQLPESFGGRPMFSEGCMYEDDRVIHILDDERDAKFFFWAIYDSGFFERPPAETSYDVVLAILKLSTKYEVAYLRKRALAHLCLSYPLTLDQWNRRQKVSTLAAELEVDAWPGSTSKTLKVIEAAKTLDIPWILPAAYYDCSTASLELLLNYSKWNDGSIDLETKNSILIGYHKQATSTHSKMLEFLYCAPLDNCMQKEVCGEERRRFYCATQEWSITKPLDVMVDGDWECYLGDLCELCLGVAKVQFEQAREEFWERLPEIYGLPKWEVLVGKYEEAVGDTHGMHLGD